MCIYINTYIGILHFLQHIVQHIILNIILNIVLEGQSEDKNIHLDDCQFFGGWQLVTCVERRR